MVSLPERCGNGGCTRPPRDGLKTCQPCFDKASAWYHNNKDRANLERSMRKFGLTGADFEAMFGAQGGLCAICEQPEEARYRGGKVKRLAVDHNHDTGEVRALLCNNCNRALGMFKDNAIVLRAAADYVERFS